MSTTTVLRQRMVEDMSLRNLAPRTHAQAAAIGKAQQQAALEARCGIEQSPYSVTSARPLLVSRPSGASTASKCVCRP